LVTERYLIPTALKARHEHVPNHLNTPKFYMPVRKQLSVFCTLKVLIPLALAYEIITPSPISRSRVTGEMGSLNRGIFIGSWSKMLHGLLPLRKDPADRRPRSSGLLVDLMAPQ
jgi:hypothetical protein